jgi:hypothetical protein
VITIQQANYATGAEIEMRLMRRERNSLLAFPVGNNDIGVGDVEEARRRPYVKLIKVSRAEVRSSLKTVQM